jgi:hypothetical protein
MFDELTVDHKTWSECRREIVRCRDESCGLFFLSLLSEKYGYKPLPRKLDRRSFHSRVDTCQDESLKALAAEWYKLDSNETPPIYRLRTLNGVEDSTYWTHVLPQLRQLFEGVRFEKSYRAVEIARSVTEWEVKLAFSRPEDISRVLCVRRELTGEFDNTDYCDTKTDSVEKGKLDSLKNWIDFTLPPTRSVSFSVPYNALRDRQGGAFKKYTTEWENKICELLLKEVRKTIKLRSDWDENGCGLGISGAVAAEFLHHPAVAYDLCKEFTGRRNLLSLAISQFQLPSRFVATQPASGISFALYGEAGNGKSTLLAKLADEIYQLEKQQPHSPREGSRPHKNTPRRPVIVRFCGSNENSIDSRVILKFLVEHLRYLFGSTETSFHRIPTDLDLLNDYIYYHPVVLIIDGVDNLEGGLDFLFQLTPHRDTRVIVSLSAASSLLHDLQCENVPCIEVPRLNEEIREMMVEALHFNNHVLRENQLAIAFQQAAVEPTALYMSLALRVMIQWKSDDVNPTLEPSLAGIVNQILDSIQNDCGQVMTRRALALITFSAVGINDIGKEYIIRFY